MAIPLPMPGTGLPVPLTSFVGREREVAVACDLLRRADARIITLTGPGGVGKTRLAIAIACEIGAEFSDGVFFVSLAAVTSSDHVLPSLAGVLGIRDKDEQSLLSSLVDHLHRRKSLLLLDNFERLVETGPSIVELVASCSSIKVMATSRVLLRVSGEREFIVQPLALPDATKPLPVEDARLNESVRLFCDRAQLANPDFALNGDNVGSVVSICGRLDGLPLAIELAAARTKILPPLALLARLEPRLPLLTSGALDLPHRLRTMRNALAWSHDLLSSEERAAFRRLAVFAGGFTLEAAEVICTAGSKTIGDVLSVVSSLVDKSLLRQLPGTAVTPRFGMLDTIREYALEQLETSGELVVTREQHSALYLALAEHAAGTSQDTAQQEWLDRLDDEQDNLRAALRWNLESDNGEGALRLCISLSDYWRQRGQLGEGRRWTARALAGGEGASPAWRCEALTIAARLAVAQSDWEQASTLASDVLSLVERSGTPEIGARYVRRLLPFFDEESLVRARSLCEAALEQARDRNDYRSVAEQLRSLGWMANHERDYNQSDKLHDKAIGLSRSLGDSSVLAESLFVAGESARLRRDYARATALLGQALTVQREIGASEREAHTLGVLGHIAMSMGDHVAARSLQEQSLEVSRRLGDRHTEAGVLQDLGWLCRDQGDYQQAQLFQEQALMLWRELGDLRYEALGLDNLAEIALDMGEPDRAADLYKELMALSDQTGDKLDRELALLGLAEVARVKLDLQRAETLYDEVIELTGKQLSGPTARRLFHGMGEVALDRGDPERAMLSFFDCLISSWFERDKRYIPLSFIGLGQAAVIANRRESAASILGMLASLLEAGEIHCPPVMSVLYEDATNDLKDDLGEDSFLMAFDAGRAKWNEQEMRANLAADGPWDDKIEGVVRHIRETIFAAMNQEIRPTMAPHSVPSLAADAPYGLSAREVDVLRLVAEGLTDPDIADRLCIGKRTVSWHVGNILSKLGVASRTAAARLATREGLV